MKLCSYCKYDENPKYVDYCIRCRSSLREGDYSELPPRFKIDLETRSIIHCNTCYLDLHQKISQIKFEWVSNDEGILSCPVHGRWLASGKGAGSKTDYQKWVGYRRELGLD